MSEVELIVIPDPDEPQAAELMVEGTVGERRYRFLLDTGAGRSTVAFDDYTEMFPFAGQSESGGLFAGKTEDLIVIPSLRVGPIARTDLVITRLPEGASDRRGLLGMDVLGGSSWNFRFREKRAFVDRPFEAGSSPLHDLRMDRKGHPYVDIQLDGDPAEAVWDTGAGVTVVDLEFIVRHQGNFENAGQSTGTDSTGTSRETPMYLMTGARVGGVVFPPHRVAGVDLSRVNATIDMPMDMILGYTTLRLADWYFDFPARKWALLKTYSGPG